MHDAFDDSFIEFPATLRAVRAEMSYRKIAVCGLIASSVLLGIQFATAVANANATMDVSGAMVVSVVCSSIGIWAWIRDRLPGSLRPEIGISISGDTVVSDGSWTFDVSSVMSWRRVRVGGSQLLSDRLHFDLARPASRGATCLSRVFGGRRYEVFINCADLEDPDDVVETLRARIIPELEDRWLAPLGSGRPGLL